MRLAPLFAVTLTLAGCAKPEHPDWMIGTWRFQRPAAPGVPQGCAGGIDPRIYAADGSYREVDPDEAGRWEIKGSRLIHHPLRVRGRAIPEAEQSDYIFRINARSPDRIDVNRGPDPQMTMLRCGPAEATAVAPDTAPTAAPSPGSTPRG